MPPPHAMAQAIEWMCSTTADEVIQWREGMLQRLEEAATAMEDSGLQAEWFKEADDPIRKIAGKANLPLFHTLLRASRYVDPECVFLLCDGTIS